MKQLTFFPGILLAIAASASAVDFNTDALKAMQQEGHKMVAEAQDGRAFKTANGLCLDVAGKALMVRKCKSSGSSQTWHFDEQDRLVSSDGRCVAGPTLASCGAGKNQQWRLDGQNRLARAGNQCLQTQGNPPGNGAKVIVKDCSGAANQVWR